MLDSAPAPVRKSKAAKAPAFQLKTPKGTKDWADKDMVIREAIFTHLLLLFKRHGGVTIDTPVFELREILAGKYGEDLKLIYNLEDQGGELTLLRYDLTVPFARFVAMNNILNIKRYHIAKVYRRDQPAMTKGRMREFYQCDFDVAGLYDVMVPDAEILLILVEGLTGMGVVDFKVKLNHRKILDGMFQVCGVALEDVRKVLSAVDKLDKLPWEAVRKEMVVDKAQPEEVADRIGLYVKHRGTIREVVAILEQDEALVANQDAAQGLLEMKILADYLDAFGIQSYTSFDLLLARGLDYYTGLIYECVTEALSAPANAAELKAKAAKSAGKDGEVEDASEFVGVGSIAAGGRYDGLVGMFAAATGKKLTLIPCVGVLFGVERIFLLVKQRAQQTVRALATQVYVMAFGDLFLAERMAIAKQLWDAGVETEYLYKAKANPRKQFEAAEKAGCPVAVIIGKEEHANGTVKVKMLGKEHVDAEVVVPLAEMVDTVVAKLKETQQDGVSDIARLLQGL